MVEQHIMPINDLREHVETLDCWCGPRQDNDAPDIVIHNSLDRREQYETGARRPQ